MSKSRKEREPERGSEKGPVLRFLLLFAGLALGFEVLFVSLIADSSWMDFHLGWNAAGAAWLLNVFGADVQRYGTQIAGRGGAIDVQIGCDGLQAIALFAFAVVAFPAERRMRVFGVAVGILALVGLNLVRIATLYWLVVHHRAHFEDAHLVFWPMAFILGALALWMAWVRLAVPPLPPVAGKSGGA